MYRKNTIPYKSDLRLIECTLYTELRKLSVEGIEAIKCGLYTLVHRNEVNPWKLMEVPRELAVPYLPF